MFKSIRSKMKIWLWQRFSNSLRKYPQVFPISNGMKKVLTLCLIHTDSHILLGMKKRGFGQGKWNGFGGKIEKGETIDQAARREMFEEAGLTVGEVSPMGILHFSFPNDPVTLEVRVFRADTYEGELKEGDEMKPQWFPIDEIPFESMWPDDKHWLPLFLSGKKFKGEFFFDNNNMIANHHLEVVEVL